MHGANLSKPSVQKLRSPPPSFQIDAPQTAGKFCPVSWSDTSANTVTGRIGALFNASIIHHFCDYFFPTAYYDVGAGLKSLRLIFSVLSLARAHPATAVILFNCFYLPLEC